MIAQQKVIPDLLGPFDRRGVHLGGNLIAGESAHVDPREGEFSFRSNGGLTGPKLAPFPSAW